MIQHRVCKRCGYNRPEHVILTERSSITHIYYKGSGDYKEECKTAQFQVDYDDFCWFCKREIAREKERKRKEEQKKAHRENNLVIQG